MGFAHPDKHILLSTVFGSIKEKRTMIITQKKPIEEVMAMVGDAKTVGIVGCNSCATACQTGGQPQIDELTKVLEAAG